MAIQFSLFKGLTDQLYRTKFALFPNSIPDQLLISMITEQRTKYKGRNVLAHHYSSVFGRFATE